MCGEKIEGWSGALETEAIEGTPNFGNPANEGDLKPLPRPIWAAGAVAPSKH